MQRSTQTNDHNNALVGDTPRDKRVKQVHTKPTIDVVTLPDLLQHHILSYLVRFPQDAMMATWNKIPQKVYVSTMRPLEHLVLVCGRWHRTLQPLISASRHVYLLVEVRTDEDLVLRNDTTQVLHLDLVVHVADIADAAAWRHFFQHFPKLVRLDLSMETYNVKYDTSLLEALPLTSLQVFDVSVHGPIQAKSAVECIESSVMPALKTLIFRRHDDSHDMLFTHDVFGAMPNLERFVISVCEEDTAELERIAHGLTRCTRLKEYVQFLANDAWSYGMKHCGRVCRIVATETSASRIILGAEYFDTNDDESVEMLIQSLQCKPVRIELCGLDASFDTAVGSRELSCKVLKVLGTISSPIKGDLDAAFDGSSLEYAHFARDDLVSMVVRSVASYEVYYRSCHIRICTELFTVDVKYELADMDFDDEDDHAGSDPASIYEFTLSPPKPDPILANVCLQVSQPSGPTFETSLPGNWEDVLLHADPLPLYMTKLLIEATIQPISYSRLRVVPNICGAIKDMDVDAWTPFVDVPFAVSLLDDTDSVLIVRKIDDEVTVLPVSEYASYHLDKNLEEYFDTVFDTTVDVLDKRRYAGNSSYRSVVALLDALVSELQSGGNGDRFFEMDEYPQCTREQLVNKVRGISELQKK